MAPFELLLAVIALIVGGLQLIGGPGQTISGWICVGLGTILFAHYFYNKFFKKSFLHPADIKTPAGVFKVGLAMRINESLALSKSQILAMNKELDFEQKLRDGFSACLISEIGDSFNAQLQEKIENKHFAYNLQESRENLARIKKWLEHILKTVERRPDIVRPDLKVEDIQFWLEPEMMTTRLDDWFKFVDAKICQGKRYYADPTTTSEQFIEYFDEVKGGLETAIKQVTKFYPFLSSIGWEYKRLKDEYIKFSIPAKHQHLQNLIKIILDGLKPFSKNNKPLITDRDFNDNFESSNLKHYWGEKCP